MGTQQDDGNTYSNISFLSHYSYPGYERNPFFLGTVVHIISTIDAEPTKSDRDRRSANAPSMVILPWPPSMLLRGPGTYVLLDTSTLVNQPHYMRHNGQR